MEKLEAAEELVAGFEESSLTVKQCLEITDEIYRARHDAVIEIYCTSRRLAFLEEVPMEDFLERIGRMDIYEDAPGTVKEIMRRKTPDMIISRMDGSVEVIEITVQVDLEKAIKQKEDKYKIMTDWMDVNKIRTRLTIIAVTPGGRNAEKCGLDIGDFNSVIERSDAMLKTVRERLCDERFRGSLGEVFKVMSGGVRKYKVPEWAYCEQPEYSIDEYDYDVEIENMIEENIPSRIREAFSKELGEYQERFNVRSKVSPWVYFPDIDVPFLISRIANLGSTGWLPECWEGNFVRKLVDGLTAQENEMLMMSEKEYKDCPKQRGRTMAPETLRLRGLDEEDDEILKHWHVKCKEKEEEKIQRLSEEDFSEKKIDCIDFMDVRDLVQKPQKTKLKYMPMCAPVIDCFRQAEEIRRSDIDPMLTMIRENGWTNLARCNARIAWWLTSQMGERRSTGWSVMMEKGFCLVKAPSKSILKSGSNIKFFWIADNRMGHYIPEDMVEKVVGNCSISKKMTISSKKIGVMEGAGVKVESTSLYICDMIQAERGEVRENMIEETCKSCCMIILGCSKRMSGITDNVRYLYMQARADWSGIRNMIKGVLQPCKNRAEALMQQRLVSTLEEAIGEKGEEDGEGIKLRSTGFLSRVSYNSAYAAVEEIIAAFFLVPKGMHGIQENFKIMEETNEYADLFENQAKRYGKRMTEGFRAGVPCRSGYNRNLMYTLGKLVANKVGDSFGRVLSALFTSRVTEPYFMDGRNNSSKSMSKKVGPSLTPTKSLYEAIGATSKGDFETGLRKMEKNRERCATRLTRKYQRTVADRGIFLPTQSDRICSYVVEQASIEVSKVINEESISRPGDIKAQDLQQINAATRGMKNRVFFSVDYTKWSPGDNGFKFSHFLWGLFEGKLPNGMIKDMGRSCDMSSDFDFYLSKDMLAVRDRGILGEKAEAFFRSYDADGKRRIRGNWKQGMFNYTSSLVGVGVLELTVRKLKAKGVLEECWFRQHSDDCLIVADLKEGFTEGDLLDELMKVGSGASLLISKKKTYSSKNFAEFVGMIIEGKTVRSQPAKFLVTCTSEKPGTGLLSDMEAVMSMAQQALRMGVRLNVGVTVALMCMSETRLNYSMGSFLKNDPRKVIGVPAEDVLCCLGGKVEDFIYESLLIDVPIGVMMSDERAMRTKNPVALRVNRRMIAEWRSDEEEPTGWVDVNWSIFQPRDLEKFKDLKVLGAQIVEDHPEFWFMLPEGNETAPVLANRLNSRSMQASLASQNPLALRAILGASVKGNSVRFGGKKITYDAFIAELKKEGKEEDLPRIEWRAVERIEESLSKMRVVVDSAVAKFVPCKIAKIGNLVKPIKIRNQMSIVCGASLAIKNQNRGLMDRARRVCRDDDALLNDISIVEEAVGESGNLLLHAKKMRKLSRTIGILSGNRFALMGHGYEQMKGGYMKYKIETCSSNYGVKVLGADEISEVLVNTEDETDIEKEREVALAVSIWRNKSMYPELDSLLIKGRQWEKVIEESQITRNIRLNKLVASAKADLFDDYSLLIKMSQGMVEASVRWIQMGDALVGGTIAEILVGTAKAVLSTSLDGYLMKIGMASQNEVDSMMKKAKEILRSEGKQFGLTESRPGNHVFSGRFGYYWGQATEGARVVRNVLIDKSLVGGLGKMVVEAWMAGGRQMVTFEGENSSVLWSTKGRTGSLRDPKGVTIENEGWARDADNVGGVNMKKVVEDGLLVALLEDRLPKMAIETSSKYIQMGFNVKGWVEEALKENDDLEMSLDMLDDMGDFEVITFMNRIKKSIVKVGSRSAIDVETAKGICEWYKGLERTSNIVREEVASYIPIAMAKKDGTLTDDGKKFVEIKVQMAIQGMKLREMSMEKNLVEMVEEVILFE